MNKKILRYIDNHLAHAPREPMEQLVYVIAKLSLVSSPTAWLVKRVASKENVPFLHLADALSFIKKHTNSTDYIIPLYTTVKVEMCADEITLLIPPPSAKPGGEN